MNTENALKKATELLAPWASAPNTPEPNRLDFQVAPGDLPAAVQTLIDRRWGYLSAITGMDPGAESGLLEGLYHFCSGAAIVTLRVGTPRAAPSIPSICHIIPSASLYEREVMEMFGIEMPGTPNTERLFLPDDWPSGVYPLRKDWDPKQAPLPAPRSTSGPDPELVAQNGSRYTIPIGPQHPALKEPGHFEFTVDGEIVTGAAVRLGYVHRGIEKAAEERTWIQNLYLFERICGICSHTHSYAYTLGVERLAGVEVSARAQAIRELVAGLERIHSHLLWLGVAAHEAGFDTLFMYSWRDRETVMDLLEGLTGNRVNYSINVLGGVKCDVDAEQAAAIRKGMDFLEQRSQHYLDVVTTDAAFLQRTRGVGTMSAEEVERLGVVGPTARASGVVRDVRVEAPYGAYAHYPVSTVYETAGDLEAKFVVRIKELFVSYKTILSIIDNLPEGELAVRFPRKIPAGETISRVEAPRGELLYFIKSGGGEKPERIKVRTPSICNFSSVIQLVVGHQLADVPMILAGIDPCFSCNDRMVVLDRRDGQRRSMAWEDLRQYGIERYKA
ncbi:MAG: NADH-quinone oxidoreductase subunit C [Chloroflexota bacterium]